MAQYELWRAHRVKRDEAKCRGAGLEPEYNKILDTLEDDPFRPTQHFKRLKGHLKGAYSRRIDGEHRVVYTIHPNTESAMDEHGKLYKGAVYIHCAWGHDYSQITLPQ